MTSSFILRFMLAGMLCSVHEIIHAQNLDGFAVVELFTSEGCSSCPPADEAAMELSKEYKSNVYFLGFHVDYWDRLGWKDPFSDPAFSLRQQEYAHFFDEQSIYTPQVIVNGSTQLVGSDKIRLQKVIQEDLKKNDHLVINLQAEDKDGKSVNVSYHISGASGHVLNIALVQLQGQTAVKRGENEGRLLRHINIVREFRTIDMPKENGMISLSIPSGSGLNNFKVIAYLQDQNTWHISGSAETEIVHQ